jgi:hypothetical protein
VNCEPVAISITILGENTIAISVGPFLPKITRLPACLSSVDPKIEQKRNKESVSFPSTKNEENLSLVAVEQ